MIVKDWPATEMSTRNCFHCHATTFSGVRCSKGYDLKAQYDEVIKATKLLDYCKLCSNWEVAQ
jgi:hypothetical protein